MGPVVLSTCLSRLSEPAAASAVALARATAAPLHVVHAVERESSIRLDVAMTAKASARVETDANIERELRAFCERFRMKDVLATALLLEGKIAEQVVRYASKVNASYLVVGTSASTGLSAVVLGSVADAIVRTSIAPVLIVRYNIEVQ
jgi:nucleotide-binding universal stress UspA family protein